MPDSAYRKMKNSASAVNAIPPSTTNIELKKLIPSFPQIAGRAQTSNHSQSGNAQCECETRANISWTINFFVRSTPLLYVFSVRETDFPAQKFFAVDFVIGTANMSFCLCVRFVSFLFSLPSSSTTSPSSLFPSLLSVSVFVCGLLGDVRYLLPPPLSLLCVSIHSFVRISFYFYDCVCPVCCVIHFGHQRQQSTWPFRIFRVETTETDAFNVWPETHARIQWAHKNLMTTSTFRPMQKTKPMAMAERVATSCELYADSISNAWTSSSPSSPSPLLLLSVSVVSFHLPFHNGSNSRKLRPITECVLLTLNIELIMPRGKTMATNGKRAEKLLSSRDKKKLDRRAPSAVHNEQ